MNTHPARHALPEAKKQIIVDTDMGWDDWLAILFLMQHPDIDLVGITVTGCGEAHLVPGVRNARNLLQLGGQPWVPVCAGADRPLRYNNTFPEAFRLDMDNVFGLTLPENPLPADKRHAVTFMRDTLRESQGKMTLFSIGGLTNLGLLLRDYADDVADKIERIVIMGGAVHVEGNVAPLSSTYATNLTAEWNLFIDVLGTHIVLDSPIPLTFVPLDACNHVEVTHEFVAALAACASTMCARFAARILERKLGPNSEGMAMYFYDPLAAAVLVEAAGLVETTEMRLRVIQEMTEVADHAGRLVEDPLSRTSVTVCTAANRAAFEDRFLRVLNLVQPAADPPDQGVRRIT